MAASAISGMQMYIHPSTPQDAFEILGEKNQIVTIKMHPGQTVASEEGCMLMMSDNIKMQVGSGGLVQGVLSVISGEEFFRLIYHNASNHIGYVGLTPNLPGTVIPVNMQLHPNGLLCKRGAYFGSLSMDTRTKIGVQSSRTCVACLCSGLSLFMQKITGGTWAFLTCHGTIMQKTLRAGETVVVDTHSIVALEPSVEVDIRCVGCMRCQCIWMGEGACNTTLTGPGLVILTSLPIEKLRRLFIRPQKGKKKNQAKS